MICLGFGIVEMLLLLLLTKIGLKMPSGKWSMLFRIRKEILFWNSRELSTNWVRRIWIIEKYACLLQEARTHVHTADRLSHRIMATTARQRHTSLIYSSWLAFLYKQPYRPPPKAIIWFWRSDKRRIDFGSPFGGVVVQCSPVPRAARDRFPPGHPTDQLMARMAGNEEITLRLVDSAQRPSLAPAV